ncbi:MAG: hypothetical protein MUF75_07800 [Bacteroidia bacterium]|jgi:hypothetical protein|nr:hypothetical protein [Bacteroidia bacterium]
MYKKDYLQRQFEAFGKALAMLYKLRKDKELITHETELMAAFAAFTSYSLEQIEGSDQKEFERIITADFSLTSEKLHKLADLVFEKFCLYMETGESNKANTMGLKSRFLYSLFQNNLTENEFNLEVHYRLNLLDGL